MIRTPLQWLGENNAGFTTGTSWESVNADNSVKNVTLQLENPASLLSFFRELIQIRTAHPAPRCRKVIDKALPCDTEDPETTVGRCVDLYVTTLGMLSQSGQEMFQGVHVLTHFTRPGDKIATRTLDTFQPLSDSNP